MAEKNGDDLPPLDKVLDMNEWPPGMKEWYMGCNSLRILTVGRSGVGKSTLINAMFADDVAPIAQGRDPTTMVVKGYQKTVGGVTLHFFDSPGLQDGKKSDHKYTEDMKESCKVVNLLLFCIRMDNQVRDDDITTIKLVSQALGKGIWKHAICVLTQGNQVEPMMKNQGTPKEYFNRIFNTMKEKIQAYVQAETGVKIPVVASGHPMKPPLPICEDWRTKVLAKCIEKCSDEGAIALMKSHWGKYAAGSLATAGTTAGGAAGVALAFGPPGWVASAGLAAISAIAGTIGAVALSKYGNHQGKIDAITKEMGGSVIPRKK